MKAKSRCWWCGDDPLYVDYHDNEWGIPLHDDYQLFEMLILEGFQAGLSWITVLRKREYFREAFLNFDPNKIRKMTDKHVEKLMQNSNIIRNRLKITGAIINAQCFLDTQKEFGNFDKYLWQFTNYKTLRNKNVTRETIPTRTSESDAMAKDLKKRGFKFVGTTICYAHMQATGMVNDHTKECFKSR